MAGPLDLNLRLLLSDSLSVSHGAFYFCQLLRVFSHAYQHKRTVTHRSMHTHASPSKHAHSDFVYSFIRLYLLACIHI